MINYLDIIGYIASFIILVSLLSKSILKLRWINLFGSLLFFVYGILINSIPTAVMNLAVAFINVFYLYKLHTSKIFFEILEIKDKTKYLEMFLDFHKKDINEIFKTDEFIIDDNTLAFYILRNLVPAGLFIGKIKEETLIVKLDYVSKEYRDFKAGKMIYLDYKDFFIKKNISNIISYSDDEKHIKYLKKMGFEKEEDRYILRIK